VKVQVNYLTLLSIVGLFLFGSVSAIFAGSHALKTEVMEVAAKEGSSWDKAKKETGEAAGAVGEAVKETSTKAWDATKSTSKEAWETTKDGAEKAADYTTEKSEQAWDKTKEVSKDVWEATKEVTGDAVDATKDGYENVKEKVGGLKK